MSYTKLRDSTPTARKERRCELCGKSIKIGERYSREAGVFDGDFQDISLHLDCAQIVQDFINDSDTYDIDCGFTYDQIWDWHRECELEETQ